MTSIRNAIKIVRFCPSTRTAVETPLRHTFLTSWTGCAQLGLGPSLTETR